MQNYALLDEAGGNKDVILCKRWVLTFETFTRNSMDLNAIPAVRRLSHPPIVADPSHGTGRWYLVTPMARTAAAAEADGSHIIDGAVTAVRDSLRAGDTVWKIWRRTVVVLVRPPSNPISRSQIVAAPNP